MEPYIETYGDKDSWGFRPGRSTNHAIPNLAQILAYFKNNLENLYKFKYLVHLISVRAKYKTKEKMWLLQKSIFKT